MSDVGEDGDGHDPDEDVLVVFRLSNQSMGTKTERERSSPEKKPKSPTAETPGSRFSTGQTYPATGSLP